MATFNQPGQTPTSATITWDDTSTSAGTIVSLFPAPGYEIDGKKNEVKFPFAKDAAAKPTKDGALLLAGQFTFGGRTYTVPETRIERAKPK